MDSMNSIEICQLGNPVLRQIAEPVINFADPEIQQLIDRMLALTQQSQGMGLAAPQIGRSHQIIIISSHPNSRYPFAPQMQPTVLVNPKILSHSESQQKSWEGCLSVPGLRGMISRFESIEISFSDRHGKLQQTRYEDFVARIFQHEFDHLQGLVFVDRLESSLDLFTEAEFLKKLAKP
jgi:peptide deformylase